MSRGVGASRSKNATAPQAQRAFTRFLPDSAPVNLVTDRHGEGRVYASTYPTMLTLLNEATDGELEVRGQAVWPGDHRRGPPVGVPPVPAHLRALRLAPGRPHRHAREDIDHNTYDLFDLRDGVPTNAYTLAEAVADGLPRPAPGRVDPDHFLRRGIVGARLNPEEQSERDDREWGEERVEAPDEVDSEEQP